MTNKEHLVKTITYFAKTQVELATQQYRGYEKEAWNFFLEECSHRQFEQEILKEEPYSDRTVTYFLRLFYETVECNEILERTDS